MDSFFLFFLISAVANRYRIPTSLSTYLSQTVIPVTPQQHSLVNALNAHISKDSLRERVTKFSSYPTRFYQSPTGVEAAEWIYSQAAGILANYSRPDAVSVTKFAHSWKQNSVIARIEGTTNAEEIVILGAHLDSINQSPFNKNAPGADDDATGSMTLLELLTIVVAQDYRPTRSVEFHWYSAEEVGLKGSIDIAGSYQRQQKKVAGMLQLDMTGWNKGFIGILTDFTDPELTKLLRKLVDTYTTAARKDFKCSYSCSDHASWNRAGYRSAMSFEADMKNDNIYIHTEKDTVDKLDWEHAANIARVAMGFLIEMSA